MPMMIAQVATVTVVNRTSQQVVQYERSLLPLFEEAVAKPGSHSADEPAGIS
jgi:hypothetical protein